MNKGKMIYCICLMCMLLSCFPPKIETNVNVEDLKCRNSAKTHVKVETSLSKDTISVRLLNVTDDTIYIFDSYLQTSGLDRDIIKAKEIYRYDKKSDTYKISFQPIHACLFYIQDDRLILGPNRISEKFQIKYSFEAIPPHGEYSILIPEECLPEGQWIDDFDADSYNAFDFGMEFTCKDKNLFQKGKSKLTMELCLYETIENLNLDYLCEFPQIFDMKIKDYQLLSVPIDLYCPDSN